MKRSVCCFVAVLVLRIVPATAQPSASTEPRALERIEQLKKVRMIDALDLSEDQSVKFFSRLHERDGAREGLRQKKMAALDKLERMVRNDVKSEEYSGVFPELNELDQKLLDLDQKFFESLSDILSEEQRAKFMLFERQFHRELQDALMTIQRKRNGGGDGEK